MNEQIPLKIDTNFDDTVPIKTSPSSQKKERMNYICNTFRYSGNYESYHKFLWYFLYFLKKANDLGKIDNSKNNSENKVIYSLLIQIFVIIKNRIDNFVKTEFNNKYEKTIYQTSFWNHFNWEFKTPLQYCIEYKCFLGVELLLSIKYVKVESKYAQSIFSLFPYDPWFFRSKIYFLFLQRMKEQKHDFTIDESFIVFKQIKRVMNKEEYEQRREEFLAFFDCLSYGNFLIIWNHAVVPNLKYEKDGNLVRSLFFYYRLRKAEFESKNVIIENPSNLYISFDASVCSSIDSSTNISSSYSFDNNQKLFYV